MRQRGRAGSILAAIAATVAMLALAAPAPAAEPVTASGDALRSGWYPDQAGLSPAVVSGGSFGKLFETPVQGQVYAQPLVSNGTLLVVTEDNWAYGLDPATGAVKWSRSFGTPFVAAEIPGCTDLVPNVGITGTPVIDPDSGLAYFLAKTYSAAPKTPIWQLHAVSMANGQEAPGFPVNISGEAENLAGINFDAKQELQRPGLLLMEGVVYAGFGSHCDNRPYQGWLIGVSTAGQIRTRWATGPDGTAIWQAGGGLISDGPGQILFATGNSFGPTPPNSPTPPSDLGEAVARVAIGPTGATTATDFFSPFNREELDEKDLDLGSSAPIALPSQYFGTPAVPNLLLVGGKEHKIFVLDRGNLGGQGQGAGGKNKVVQEIPNVHSVFGSMAIWPGQGGYVYVPGTTGTGSLEVLQYGTAGGKPSFSIAGEATPALRFGSGSPVVTSDGTTPGSAVVWVPQCTTAGTCANSTLSAYGAIPSGGKLPLLWSAPIGISPKFGRPGVAGGRVYVGTRDNRVIGFGGPEVPGGNPGGGGGAGAGSGAGSGPGTGSPQGPALPLPRTTIKAARLLPARGTASFRFGAGGAPERFECRLLRQAGGGARAAASTGAAASARAGAAVKRHAFNRCTSPRVYRHLGPGAYVFEVRAANAAGLDRSPARRSFSF